MGGPKWPKEGGGACPSDGGGGGWIAGAGGGLHQDERPRQCSDLKM